MKQIETLSYSFYSVELHQQKMDIFTSKATDIRDFKNNLSNYISENFETCRNLSKFDMIVKFGKLTGNPFTSSINIRGNELQKAVEDVFNAYENKFEQVTKKIQFNIQSAMKIDLYKKNGKNFNKGDRKSFSIIKKQTLISKQLCYLSNYGFNGIRSYFEQKLLEETEKTKINFYNDFILTIDKFGEDRLLSLAFSKRDRLFKIYNKKPIEFKQLSYRSALQSKNPLIQNNKGFTNAVIVIPGFCNRTMIVPTNFNQKHHGHLNSFKSNEYTVKILEDKNQVKFITTKKVKVNYAENKYNFLGVDTNIKHNLFATSINREIDFDRKEFNKFVTFLRKTDKDSSKLTNGEKQILTRPLTLL